MGQVVTPSGDVVATRASAATPAAGRLDAIDLLRGLAMALMALDHVRAYLSVARFDPVDLSQTTPAYFLTRWVTHFVAPAFVLLAGTAAFLSGARGKSRADLSRFLFTRGLWLVLLELTVVAVAWTFDPDVRVAQAGVIWAIGWSMVALAGLVRLPVAWTGAVGVALISGHHALDGVGANALGPFAPAWRILHEPGLAFESGAWWFYVAYPLVPWIGVMAAGYALGQVFLWDVPRRDRFLARLGLACVGAFVALRAVNVYGDPAPWSVQPTALGTVLSFLNCTKYPPSLLFLLMTLGPALAVLPVLARWRGPAARFFTTFGRVPLLYYVAHLVLIHAFALGLAVLVGNTAAAGMLTSNVWYSVWNADFGYGWGLPLVYVAWVGVLLLLFPLCAWFADVKRRRKDWWLSYL